MIRIRRHTLSAVTTRVLNRRQQRVMDAEDRIAEAHRSWATLGRNARVELLGTLQAMSHGLARCMYCEDSMGTDIDHFRPKASHPECAFQWQNYFLACSHCNSNAKRDEFPMLADGHPALIDPVLDDPFDHIVYSPGTGLYRAIDSKGAESIRVFALNRQICVDGRRAAWVALESLIVRYHAAEERRSDILETIGNFPFQGVRMHLGRTMESPQRNALVAPEVVESLLAHPELTARA